jgi:hypothetical protein
MAVSVCSQEKIIEIVFVIVGITREYRANGYFCLLIGFKLLKIAVSGSAGRID